MPNIAHSIQDYCKRINSRLTFADIVSLLLSLLGIIVLIGFILFKTQPQTEVIYKEGDGAVETSPSKPFASKNGATYTFDWCSGSSRIAAKNKITFSSEEEAKQSGRTLSKLCKK